MATKTAKMHGVEEMVRMHVDFFNNRQLAEGARHTTPDCEWTIVPFEETYKGPKGYVECNENWTTAFPDGKVHITRVIASDNTAVLEFRGKGTHKGVLDGPKGKIQPTGKKVDVPMIEIYEFKNEKLHRVRSYFDAATMLNQLGAKF